MRLYFKLRCGIVNRVALSVRIKVDCPHHKAAAAGLMAFAATSTLAKSNVAHQAAPRFRDTLGSVDKTLNLDTRLTDNFRNFLERAFSCQHHPRRPLGHYKTHGIRIRKRKLGRNMNRDACLFAEGDDSPVRDDNRVHIGLREGNDFGDSLLLALKHNRV